MRDRSDRTEFRRNMRSLIQKQAMLPKSEVIRLRAIERAARAMMATKCAVGTFEFTTFDKLAIEALSVQLERKPRA